MSRISTLIKQIVRPMIKDQLVRAEVVSVDKAKCTCVAKPVDSGAEYIGVKLTTKEGTGKDSIVIVPKVGSTIYVGLVNSNDSDVFVAKYSEVEEIVIHGGENGGLIKIESLIERMNKIEEKHDALCLQLESMPVAVSGAVGGPPVPGSFTSVKIMDKTLRTTLENTKIKH